MTAGKHAERLIGVRAHDYGKQEQRSLLRTIAGHGWQTIQLAYPKAVAGVGGFADVTPELVEDTKALLRETGLTVAVLGVYVEPSLTDEAARKEQVKHLYNALPQAKTLGAGCVGTETTRFAEQGSVDRTDAYRALCRSLSELLPEAERLGVNLAVEPVHYHTLNTPELTRDLLRDMGSMALKVIFDPVNLLRPEDLGSQDALWGRCMDCFGDCVTAIHIKSALPESGEGSKAPLQDSAVDYPVLFRHIGALGAPILREMAIPSEARRDIAFLRGLL